MFRQSLRRWKNFFTMVKGLEEKGIEERVAQKLVRINSVETE